MVASPTRAGLVAVARRSVAVILDNQSASGAYVASPRFPVYGYCWLRDGAFIADAMSRAGQIASAEAFFGWCARVLVDRRPRVEALIARRAAGETIPPADFLHTRYTLDGRESDAVWENFQLDGYGAWLWALDAHHRRHGRPIEPFLAGASLSARYVATFHDHPSYDWWEERPEHRHTSTLAAMAAGLQAVAGWPEIEPELRASARDGAAAIEDAIGSDAARRGHYGKWLGSDEVDASLLAIATPFAVVAADDPLMVATARRIEADLVHAGGVHRYREDTFYGGGEWLLLAGLLGSYRLRRGDTQGALRQLEWIAAHANADGDLPEQVADHLLAPSSQQSWLDRWGPVATPLLWSHAMYLTLALETDTFAAETVPAT
jgi:Glucoamylase and related glycosyl hydrolases